MLRTEEDLLIRVLLSSQQNKLDFLRQLDIALVSDMQDGGMGSIRFVCDENRHLGRAIVEADYVDSDDVLVSIVVNVDQNERLFEVDMWKVNFLPLRRYPSPEAVTIKKPV